MNSFQSDNNYSRCYFQSCCITELAFWMILHLLIHLSSELLFLVLFPHWNCWCSWWHCFWSHFHFCWCYRFCWGNVIAAAIVNGHEWLLLLLSKVLLFLFPDITPTKALIKTKWWLYAGSTSWLYVTTNDSEMIRWYCCSSHLVQLSLSSRPFPRGGIVPPTASFLQH